MNIKKTVKIAALFIFIALETMSLKAEVIYSIPLKGKEHQIGSLLNWNTANETNSQVFIVEKSSDGVDYMVIGEVEAMGESNADNGYRFLDVGVNNEMSYYRLRQVDTDGTASFSQTILLKKTMSNNYMVLAMTNTVTNDDFTITLDSSIDDEIDYAVKNLAGEIVSMSNQEIVFGINEISINVEDEEEGTYFIILNINEEVEKLVIRKVDDEIKKKENVASKKQAR